LELFGIPGTIIVQGGAVTVLLVVVLAIVTGRLVPRKVLIDVRKDRDARLKERDALVLAERARGDEWRAAAQAQDARNDVQSQQIQQLMEIGRTTNALIEGLKRASAEQL
jgi:hypothetical protein